MLLTLIRHGQSIYNQENRFTGDADVELTAWGRQEALQAGEKLKFYIFDVAFTSVLKRAEETLQIILKEINQEEILVFKNVALNERSYGTLQGLNKAETAIRYGDAQVQIWRRSFDVRPPDGESLEDTYNRVIPYYIKEIEPLLSVGKNVLVVAHGNSLRALMMYLENISKEAIVKVDIPTGIPRFYFIDRYMKLIDVRYV